MVKYDESIIATNNSSIVSKRSVEKSYYPEPHFYRHFVRKPQRRSPLINRGYWLRMRAIEHTVQRFIEEQSEHRKVIINLGCGYDPLAFQFLAKDDSSRVDTLFIDIDYPQLIAKKCQIIRSTPQLLDLLQDVESPSKSSDEAVAFRSNNYLAIGCDLRDIPQLHAVLSVEFDRNASLVLMTAEVSVTYMIVGAADALIAWAATEFNDGNSNSQQPGRGLTVCSTLLLVGAISSRWGRSSIRKDYATTLRQVTITLKVSLSVPAIG